MPKKDFDITKTRDRSSFGRRAIDRHGLCFGKLDDIVVPTKVAITTNISKWSFCLKTWTAIPLAFMACWLAWATVADAQYGGCPLPPPVELPPPPPVERLDDPRPDDTTPPPNPPPTTPPPRVRRDRERTGDRSRPTTPTTRTGPPVVRPGFGTTPSNVGGTTAAAAGSASPGRKTGFVNPYGTTWSWWWRFNGADYLNVAELSTVATTTGALADDRSQRIEVERRADRTRKTIEIFVRAGLFDADDRVRAASVLALGKCGDLTAVSILRSAIADPSGAVSENACLALGLIGGRDAQKILADVVANGAAGKDIAGRRSDLGASLRTAACTGLALASMRGASSAEVEDVLTALAFEKSADQDLTIAAIYALGATRTTSAVPRLFDLAETHANPVMRAAAVTAIGHIGDRSVLQRLVETARGNAAEVRRSALIAVGEIATVDDVAAVDLLAHAAKDESDLSARRFAIMALGKIAGPIAIENLLSVADKSDDADAAFAALALGIAGSRTKEEERAALGTRVHLGMKRAESCETIGAWAVACGLLHRTEAIVDIVGIMESKAHGHLRGDCAHALGLMGEKKVLAKLVERVRFDDDTEVRYGALQAIMMLGDRSTVAVIDGLIESTGGSVPVGSATLRGHGFLEKSGTVVALGRILRDTSGIPASGRSAAAMALGRLGDRDDVSPLRRLGRAENYTLQSNALGRVLGQLVH